MIYGSEKGLYSFWVNQSLRLRVIETTFCCKYKVVAFDAQPNRGPQEIKPKAFSLVMKLRSSTLEENAAAQISTDSLPANHQLLDRDSYVRCDHLLHVVWILIIKRSRHSDPFEYQKIWWARIGCAKPRFPRQNELC